MSAPNSATTKRGANGKFLPKPLLFHLRLPNSKTNEPKFCKILSPKNSFCKTSSTLFRHLPETLRAEHRRKMSFPFSRKISPPPNQESKEHFSSVLPSEARQWRNDSFHIGILLEKSSDFVQETQPKNSFAKTSSALFRHTARGLEGRTPKKNVLSFFKKNFTPAKSEKQETFFLGVAE